MNYDFSTVLNRHNLDAVAVDPEMLNPSMFARTKPGFSRIPMWIADMNFATVPTVQEEIVKRTQHPCFGYFAPTDEYYDSIIRWQESRNGVLGLKREHIGYENGVLGGVVSALNVLCSMGDNILLHSPTYVGFTNCITNNGWNIVHSPLKPDKDGVWRMDFEDMERKIVDNKIHTAIFCSPHNPCGRVWERWEIETAMELYRRYDVFVISDEIWSDILLNGSKHIPTQSVSEDARSRTVAFYAPSKTFNLAGLIGSYHIIYSAYLRDRVIKQSSLCHYNSMNVLSMHGLIGAYRPEGYEWVKQLRETLSRNINFAFEYIQAHFGGVKLGKPQGTYMLFLDCEEWCIAHGRTIDELLRAGQEVGVLWQDGRQFQAPYGIRMNLALPYSLVTEAFERLDNYVFNI